MKRKHLKQVLSVAVASTMLMTGTPMSIGAETDGTSTAAEDIAEEAQPQPSVQEEAPTTESENDTAESDTPAPTQAPMTTPGGDVSPTPAEDPSEEPTVTPAPDGTETPTPEPSVTPAATPTPEPSATPEATVTPSETPTPTPTVAPEEITVEWSATELEYNGEMQHPTATCPTHPELEFEYEGAESVPGHYSVRLSIKDSDGKYEVTNFSASYTIYKTVTENDINFGEIPSQQYTAKQISVSVPAVALTDFPDVVLEREDDGWKGNKLVPVGEIIDVDTYTTNASYTIPEALQEYYRIEGGSITHEETFEVTKRSVTIQLLDGVKTSKVCGEEDPEFKYTTGESDEEIDRWVRMELGEIVRVPGEAPGTYAIGFEEAGDPQNPNTQSSFETPNLVVTSELGDFTVKPLELVVGGLANYKADSFTVKVTNLPKKVKSGFTYSFVLSGEITPTVDGVTSKVTDITKLVTAPDTVAKENTFNVSLNNEFEKNNYSWTGGIPADTDLKVKVVYSYNNESGDAVEATKVSIGKKEVNVAWDKISDVDGGTNNCLTEKDKLMVTASGGDGEFLVVTKDNNLIQNGIISGERQGAFSADDEENSTHTVTAELLDTRNLSAKSKYSDTLNYYRDTLAQEIPSSNITFHNRDREIRIVLPEKGTITNVDIPGATVSGVTKDGAGTEHTLSVTIDGYNLPADGSNVSVTYKDMAGHENGTGNTSAVRSTIGTPIRFTILPEVNENNFLNGKSDTLLINGTGQACEPIRISVAGSDQTTYISQTATWNEGEVGTWSASVDMSSLPEEQEFTITAEYMDVNGPSESRKVQYKSYTSSPVVVSPIFEAMSHVSGMVEPNTAVLLVVNGEKSNFYEMKVDEFGHFVSNNIPMLFGGVDSFDIYVTDVAGNMQISHYDVPTPADPFEVSGKINPLGKFLYYYSEDQKGEDASVGIATPVSTELFQKTVKDADNKETTEEIDKIEIPLLFGMSYQVGTMTLEKSGDGFTVAKEVNLNGVDPASYTVSNEKLYVYNEQPSREDLTNHTNCTEYSYGDVIPMNGTAWIVSDADMNVLAEDLEDQEVLDFDTDVLYETFQKK